MSFTVFVIAWLMLLILFISTGGKPERDSPAMILGWLCIGVIFLAALYTMITVSFMAGVGMIGTLSCFMTEDKHDK